jgi:hypothetical protein
MPHIPVSLLRIRHNGPGRKVYRRMGKTRKTTSNYNKQVELAGPTKSAGSGMKKLANGTPMHRIRRWRFITTFGTMGRHQKLAPEHRIEYGRRCKGMWSKDKSFNYGRIRFESTGVSTA